MKYPLLFTICLVFHTLPAQQVFHQDKTLPCLDKTFSIYAHVVLDEAGTALVTEEQIVSILEQVNGAFAPICARFELCTLDSITNYNYQSIELNDPVFTEILARNHVDRRINFYFLEEVVDHCGFAGLGAVASPNDAYVVVSCPGFLTVVHELGHLFGLLHTFEGNGVELVNGDNCGGAGDGLCDTPSDPYVYGDDLSNYINGDCEFISTLLDANGEFYQPLVGNYMSYYECVCDKGFTYEQYLLMADTYLTSNPKIW